MNNDICCGCRTCEKTCPTQAITMTQKWFGFNYPTIDESKCVHCGLCNKVCPAHNIKKTTVLQSFVGYSNYRADSSSGGVFPKLAEYVISNHGIVFGAVFDQYFNVELTWTDSDFTKMLGSKYVQANVKHTYEECKEFLERNKLVLYTGTPCQIYGLKAYLKKDYNNLITVDIFCHGVASPTVWQHYLKSLNKEIDSINFRDKRNGWENFYVTIKFKDGSEYSESHNTNKYCTLFLHNKILRKSCYSCKFRSNSCADISIGDAWGIQSELNDHKGLSDIIVHTEKGKSILTKLDISKKPVSYNTVVNTNCVDLQLNIPPDRWKYMKFVDSPKIGIITLNPNAYKNVGNTLQAFALQQKINELVPNASTVEILNQTDLTNCLDFYKTHCKFVTNGYNDSYNILIAGSDQIWGNGITDPRNNDLFERHFLLNTLYNTKRIFYAPSFGHSNHIFSQEQKNRIYSKLKNERYISCREIKGAESFKKWFNLDSVPVLDPTMLFDKEFYLDSINEHPSVSKSGIFVYILDKNDEWNRKVTELSAKLNQPILSYNNSVEGFIKNMNAAACVVTDSYHGAVFSLIFNNPFIALKNISRGSDRFDDLGTRFNMNNRFINNLSNLDLTLLQNAPNAIKEMHEYRTHSISFLTNALNQI